MIGLINKLQDLLDSTRMVDFIAPLLLRLYLVPVFYMAGINKYNGFEGTVQWFGNADWGLGLPFPEVLAFLATATELGGAFLLVVGFATRWICIPLSITMLVAIFSVHLENGWLAIAEGSGIFATERTTGAIERLDRAKAILQENANYSWITEHGSLAILNNGVEFASTYFIMLVALFFLGGGKFTSVDYWVAKSFRSK